MKAKVISIGVLVLILIIGTAVSYIYMQKSRDLIGEVQKSTPPHSENSAQSQDRMVLDDKTAVSSTLVIGSDSAVIK